LKGDSFMLYANKHYVAKSIIDLDTDIKPELSPLNDVLNTSISHMTFTNETHEEQFSNIHRDIKLLKTKSKLEEMSSHDQYQYVTIGASLTISTVVLLTGTFMYYKYRSGTWRLAQQQPGAKEETCVCVKSATIECGSEPVPSARKATTSAKQVVFDTRTSTDS
jgi:hypothetical protein